MKILIVGPGMGLPIPPNGWGGIEKVVWKHTEELRRRGHQVIIINKQDKDLLLAEIIAQSPDVIHVHQEWCNAFLREQQIPFIFTSHMSSWKRNWKIVGPLLAGCTMPMPFDQMWNWYHGNMTGNRPLNAWPIWNGADSSIFKPGIKIPGFALAVGKNEPRKKFGEIIKYVQSRSDMHLTIISPDVETLQAQDKLTLIPNQLESVVAHYMGQAEYFFHLAEEEADCLVVKEAAMSGCRLILSEYCEETFLSGHEFTPDPNQPNFGPGIPAKHAWEVANSRYTWEKVVDNVEKGYLHYLKEVKGK
jgi:glycosyltransferase involved in cell wall biosynthesis